MNDMANDFSLLNNISFHYVLDYVKRLRYTSLCMSSYNINNKAL